MSHLKRSTRIHAPLEEVYAMAEDPLHWEDWYVGLSPDMQLASPPTSRPGGAIRSIEVGMAFPLTQKVLEDQLGPDDAHWRTRTNGDTQCCPVGLGHTLLMLAGEHTWTYRSAGSDTEVTVDVDFQVPSQVLADPAGRDRVEQLEAWCLEQSLSNLRRLCEAH